MDTFRQFAASRPKQVMAACGGLSLYVIGIGFFSTVAVMASGDVGQIAGWTGKDRLFRCASEIRTRPTGWRERLRGHTADLTAYVGKQYEAY